MAISWSDPLWPLINVWYFTLPFVVNYIRKSIKIMTWYGCLSNFVHMSYLPTNLSGCCGKVDNHVLHNATTICFAFFDLTTMWFTLLFLESTTFILLKQGFVGWNLSNLFAWGTFLHAWIVWNLQAFSFSCVFDATPSQPVLAIERSQQNPNHWLSGMQMETLNRIREWRRVLTA